MKINRLRGLLTVSVALGCASVAWGYAFIVNNQQPAPNGTGLPIRWPPGQISMVIVADDTTLLADGTTRAKAIKACMTTWNALLGDEVFATPTINPAGSAADNDSTNQVSFASTVYGTAFGSGILAITTVWSYGNQRAEADIVFNTSWTWESYRDSLANHLHTTIDIQRVATHELGHVLGLAHPDDNGQTVMAIMNSHVSDIIAQTPDDIAGAQQLYGPDPLNSVPPNDNFATAAAISLSNNEATVTGFNVNATKESGEPNHAGNVGGRSVWWKWTAPSAGTVNLDTQGSLFDTTLGVYTGTSVSTLTTIAFNDDVQAGVIQHSALTFSAAGGTQYFFAVDGYNGSDGVGADSAAVTLHLGFVPNSSGAPQITQQPVSASVAAGANASFTVAATGTPAPTLKWQRLPAGGGMWTVLSEGGIYTGTASVALTINGTTLDMNGDAFRCVASNSAGSATSNAATLTVTPGTLIDSISYDATTFPASARAGTTRTFTYTVTNTGTNAWGTNHFLVLRDVNGNNLSFAALDGVAAGAAITVTLTLNVPATPGSYTYYVQGVDNNVAYFSTRAALNLQATSTAVTSFSPDFNGDGHPDLLWQDTVTGARTIWLLDNGAFLGGVSLVTFSTDWSIAGTGDFNGDGQPDLVWQNTVTGERTIWLMNGTAFLSGVSLGTVSPDWSIAAIGDFNGDGQPDLVWQNTVTGARTIWLMDGTAFLSGVSLGTMPAAWSIAGVGDFNGDGQPDLLCENLVTGQCSVWLMNGATFTGAVALNPVAPRMQIAGAFDYNGDGKPDILWTNTVTGERTIWYMAGTEYITSISLGTIPLEWALLHPVPPPVPVNADFNGDGHSDLVFQNTVTGERTLWLMNGTTFLSGRSLVTLSPEWLIAGTGDFNGNGQPDLVWQNTVTGARTIWLMNGSLFLGGISLGTVPTDWSIAGAGDFNGDGRADLVWQNTATGERSLWLMDGGTFLGGASLGTVSTDWSIAAIGDFNGDGQADLIWQNTTTGERVIWLMDGGTFLGGASLGTVPTDWSITGTGDFNGDGQADLIWQNTATGERIIWLMNGTTFVSGVSLGIVPVEWLLGN